MPARSRLALLALALLFSSVRISPAAPVPAPSPPDRAQAITPESFLGFPVGADRKVADYGQINRYFEALDRASGRVALDTLGRTTLGRPLVMAVISSPANLRELERWRGVARRLADPRGLPPEEAERLIAQGTSLMTNRAAVVEIDLGSGHVVLFGPRVQHRAQLVGTCRFLFNALYLGAMTP
jgi:hypothetical protein